MMFFFSAIILLLSSCSTDNDLASDSGSNVSKTQKVRWYGAKLPNSSTETRGVADGSKRWNQDNGIYVKFLNAPSDPTILSRVRTIAKEWEVYAGIQFNFVELDKPADVRIAFDWNGNDWLTWSYTGNDAKYERDQAKPTAVIGGIGTLDEETLRGDVLRLFGQILGLEYEQRHQNWAKEGYWKSEAAMQRYWENQFDGLDLNWSEIKEYVFTPLLEQNAVALIQTEEIDEASIMAWPYYNAQQTTKPIANYELSDSDKKFIAKLYPKDKQILPTIQEAWVDMGYFKWADNTKTKLIITSKGARQEYLPDVRDGEQLIDISSMFRFLPREIIANFNLKKAPKFNTSNITDFSDMFSYVNNITEIPQYDTSNGTNFSGMLSGCSYLKEIPLLDTSNGTDFSYMFTGCSGLKEIPLLDTSKGTDFSYMFASCTSRVVFPMLNTSKGKNFSGMFWYCYSVSEIPKYDTSNGTNFSSMFERCEDLENVPLLDTSNGTDFSRMFSGCIILRSVPQFNTNNGSNFSNMFSGCEFISTIPLLETSKGSDFNSMFYGCERLVLIPKINTSNGIDFSNMFNSCKSLEVKPNLDLTNAKYTSNMYSGTIFQ